MASRTRQGEVQRAERRAGSHSAFADSSHLVPHRFPSTSGPESPFQTQIPAPENHRLGRRAADVYPPAILYRPGPVSSTFGVVFVREKRTELTEEGICELLALSERALDDLRVSENVLEGVEDV